jgi:hypothetical protein
LIHELKDLHNYKIIPKQDFNRTADLLLSMIEGSRHFKHFFVPPKALDQYSHDMAKAAKILIIEPRWQNI